MQFEPSRYIRLFEMSPVGMAVTNSNFTFLKINQAFCEMLGYSEEEAMHKTFKDFTHPDDLLHDLDSFTKLSQGKLPLYKTEKRYFHKDGHIMWGLLSLVGIRGDSGDYDYYLAVVKDITELKHVSEELAQRNEELRLLNLEKDKFFSILAHDLKSPLHNFLNLTKMLEQRFDEMSREQLMDYIHRMGENAESLYSLIENLLDWGRLRRDMIDFNPERILLSDCIESNLDFIHEAAKKKGVKIQNGIAKDTVVEIDFYLLLVILRNLLDNAIKFTPSGGSITLSSKQLDPHRVEVTIQDSGIGMSPQHIENLFRIDVKLGRPGTDGEPSSGLGLIVCKEFVERCGGELTVTSDVGVGTEVRFTIPC